MSLIQMNTQTLTFAIIATLVLCRMRQKGLLAPETCCPTTITQRVPAHFLEASVVTKALPSIQI